MRSVIVAVSDLMFRSKFREAVGSARPDAPRDEQLSVELVSRFDAALEAARRCAPERIVIDLSDTKFDAVELVRRIKSERALEETTVVGFYPHVRVELRAAALEAGCDMVLPRSALAARVLDVLEGTFPNADRREEK